MAKVIKKKPVNKLTPLEKHWTKAEKTSKELIDQLLNHNLPLEWRPQDLDLEKSLDWRIIAREDIPRFYEDYESDELPNSQYLAEQITYHYLLTLVQRLLADLSTFNCHNPAYLENLLENL